MWVGFKSLSECRGATVDKGLTIKKYVIWRFQNTDKAATHLAILEPKIGLTLSSGPYMMPPLLHRLSQRLKGVKMRYFLAIVLPPLAVLLCGKPIQFILNIFLTLLFWIPGVIHALLVVHSHLADKRTEKIVRAIREGN